MHRAVKDNTLIRLNTMLLLKKREGERKEERIEKEREGDLAAPDRSSFQWNGFDGRSG